MDTQAKKKKEPIEMKRGERYFKVGLKDRYFICVYPAGGDPVKIMSAAPDEYEALEDVRREVPNLLDKIDSPRYQQHPEDFIRLSHGLCIEKDMFIIYNMEHYYLQYK